MIFGVNGQDGSYLAELLLKKGYQVIGWVPGSISVDYENIQHILDSIVLIKGELTHQQSLINYLDEYQPDEIYNLASPSSPVASWDSTVQVGEIAGLGVARLLEAYRTVLPNARFYQASSSELFGSPVDSPQNETTPFHPRNPYGIAKLYAHWLTIRYREQYGLYAVSGILFNHESPRRAPEFVSRKITKSVAQIKLGQIKELHLGNLDAHRDWGYAGDYIFAMWMMLQNPVPQDYVIGSGETHSVKDLCSIAFAHLGLDYLDYVVSDERFFRPNEEKQLVADASKAHRLLGWAPKVKFDQLVKLMVDADLKRYSKA